MAAPRAIGIMTVRDEADILAETLGFAIEQYDHLYVVDCGSSDETAKIINECESKTDNLTFLGNVGPKIAKQVRRHIWHYTKSNHSYRDWYFIADADEFISNDYRKTLEDANRKFSDHLIGEFVNYYYTKREAKNWTHGLESVDDRQRSIRDRRRYYSFNTSQVRAFKNLPWLRWNEDTSFPVWLSRPHRSRIRFFHYQYRDPPQIETRIRIRKKMYPLADASNQHWNKTSVEEAISPDNDPELHYDAQDGVYIRSRRLPPVPEPQGSAKTLAKYFRAICYAALTKQEKSDWFVDREGASRQELG